MHWRPKDRVQAVFARQEPDRVPLNYLYSPGVDRRLKVHFGLAADADEELRQALAIDFRLVEAPYVGPGLHPEQDGIVVDPRLGFHSRYVEHSRGGHWDLCDFPLRGASVEQVRGWPLPDPDAFDYDDLRRQCLACADYGVLVGGPETGDILNGAGALFSMEDSYAAMATGDGAVLCFADRCLAYKLAVTERTLEATRGVADALWIGEDLGAQHAPLLSLPTFRQHIRPRLQRFVDLGRAYDLPVMIHSCGSSSWAFPDFIDMGIAAVETLQPEAMNMAPCYLKAAFGEALAFHGCISTAGELATGNPEDVRRVVRETLETMMPGGGYALATSHCIEENTPTANVLAMYETAREAGAY